MRAVTLSPLFRPHRPLRQSLSHWAIRLPARRMLLLPSPSRTPEMPPSLQRTTAQRLRSSAQRLRRTAQTTSFSATAALLCSALDASSTLLRMLAEPSSCLRLGARATDASAPRCTPLSATRTRSLRSRRAFRLMRPTPSSRLACSLLSRR
jgi:hypothetical protein